MVDQRFLGLESRGGELKSGKYLEVQRAFSFVKVLF